jgi:hypothetical protein
MEAKDQTMNIPRAFTADDLQVCKNTLLLRPVNRSASLVRQSCEDQAQLTRKAF